MLEYANILYISLKCLSESQSNEKTPLDVIQSVEYFILSIRLQSKISIDLQTSFRKSIRKHKQLSNAIL
ncbi:unnamed protein product [Adineta ricciae]|uniref:Uncharacterized protein n=1 Tax=Adineta ricciae TaxID=249248 RepID=A0A813MX27_ADIRI|nr:unnamed protein product [Adineta ricciae]